MSGGLFGSSNNDSADQQLALQQEQINKNSAEIEQKRAAAVTRNLNIIKSQGGLNYGDRSINQ